MFLLRLLELSQSYKKSQKIPTRAVHGQKIQIDIEKTDDEIIILVILLKRSVNYGRKGDRKIHATRS